MSRFMDSLSTIVSSTRDDDSIGDHSNNTQMFDTIWPAYEDFNNSDDIDTFLLDQDSSDDDDENVINRCLACNVNMGEQNPRQYCAKTYCREDPRPRYDVLVAEADELLVDICHGQYAIARSYRGDHYGYNDLSISSSIHCQQQRLDALIQSISDKREVLAANCRQRYAMCIRYPSLSARTQSLCGKNIEAARDVLGDLFGYRLHATAGHETKRALFNE